MPIDDEGSKPVILSTHAAPKGWPVLAQVEAYWRGLRGGRTLPLRSDVDPGRIDAALPHAFVLERVAPGVARMRVAGRALSQHLGTEAQGMPLAALFTAAARPRLRIFLDRAFDGPAVVELPVACGRGPFRAGVAGRLLILPLLGSDGEPSRALGALLLDGAAGRGPRQFDIPEDGPIRCEPVGAPPAVAYRVGPVATSPAALPAARPAAATHARPSRSERPWLRLVVSNG